MGLALFAFIAIFLLIGSAGLLVFYRAAMMQRLSAAIAPHGGREGWWNWFRPKRAGESIKAVVQPFDKVLPKSPQEVSVAQKRLIRAGFREDAHVRLFYGAKVLLPLLFCILVPVSGVTRQLSPFLTNCALRYSGTAFGLSLRLMTNTSWVLLRSSGPKAIQSPLASYAIP